MNTEIICNNGQLTVKLCGEIDHNSVSPLRKRIDSEIVRTGAMIVAFDFSGVSFMDSSGIGLILGRYKVVSNLGGRIIIYGMSSESERIMRMSGVDKFAEIF